jgi:hypothetical protein
VSRKPPARLVVVAVLAFAIGWLAGAASPDDTPLRYGDTIAGTVTLVNETGTQLCLVPDGGGEQRCGALAGPPDTAVPSVGGHVKIITAWLRRNANLDQEIFLVAE